MPGLLIPGRLGGWAKRAVDRLEPLRELIASEDHPLGERGAAALLLLVHPEGGIHLLSEVLELLLDCARQRPGRWFVVSAAYCLIQAGREEDPACRSFLNALFEIEREDWLSRQWLQRVLTRWREVSRAPVATAGVAAAGLASR